MITVQTESFEETLDELRPLLPVHYRELALNQDKVPLSPQFNVYIERERLGELLFATVRDSASLVGYFIGFIAPGLHYSTCLTCTMDIFYIHPDHRGRRTGLKLFKFVEQELRRRGVQRWFAGEKLHAPCGWLFKFIGMEPVETYWSKWLGD